ncbi:hypothetical protein F4780DRAFT_128608 [Xylariomycetidae sp. FL0641]|nr:hypothetical protein F4780DRAFT_128608 [Xylariomycetidae sp. FL0641]
MVAFLLLILYQGPAGYHSSPPFPSLGLPSFPSPRFPPLVSLPSFPSPRFPHSAFPFSSSSFLLSHYSFLSLLSSSFLLSSLLLSSLPSPFRVALVHSQPAPAAKSVSWPGSSAIRPGNPARCLSSSFPSSATRNGLSRHAVPIAASPLDPQDGTNMTATRIPPAAMATPRPARAPVDNPGL